MRTATRPVIRILIVDDEAPGRQRLEELLQDEPDCEIVAAAETGDEAVEAIRRLRPDLVFLDVQMSGKTGIEVISEIGAASMPATVLVTAYDSYALKAFELAAIDYLVKPFDDERFEHALRRARWLIELHQVQRISDELLTHLLGRSALGSHAARTGFDAAPQPAQPTYLERLPVEVGGQVRIVPVEEIDYVTVSEPFIEIHAGQRVHLSSERMRTLEKRLDPKRFMRIHRSVIVRLDRIEALIREGVRDYSVRLKGGVQLEVSRFRIEALQRWIES